MSVPTAQHWRREKLKTSVGHSTKTGHLSFFIDIKTNAVCICLMHARYTHTTSTKQLCGRVQLWRLWVNTSKLKFVQCPRLTWVVGVEIKVLDESICRCDDDIDSVFSGCAKEKESRRWVVRDRYCQDVCRDHQVCMQNRRVQIGEIDVRISPSNFPLFHLHIL